MLHNALFVARNRMCYFSIDEELMAVSLRFLLPFGQVRSRVIITLDRRCC